MHGDSISKSKSGFRGKNTRTDDSKYVLKIGLKLLILSMLVGATHLLVPWSINRRFFRLNKKVPVYVALVPVIGFVVYLFGGKGSVMSRLAHCRYNSSCSFLFVYDDQPVRNERIDLEQILDQLRPGDIVLRKHRNYLDELIFAQNSYFTHVGICSAVEGSEGLQVFHATSEHGVAPTPVPEFCNCDEVAVLRFSPGENGVQKELTGKDIEKYNREAQKIRYYIQEGHPATKSMPNLSRKELAIFDDLATRTNPGNNSSAQPGNDYLQIVLERAMSLKNTEYDLMFNFENFTRLSCIEYVWYSFKCLFPLHRIKVEDFEFFRFITLPVIIPDVFVKNDLFTHVYSSIPEVRDKQQLKQYVQAKRSPLWRFAFNILLWDALILCAAYPLLRERSKF
jgi:hypothetical protein